MSGKRHQKQRKRQQTGVYYPKTIAETKVTPVFVHDIDKDKKKFIVNKKIAIFDDIVRLSQEELMAYVTTWLFSRGYTKEKSFLTKDYLYLEGDIPVLLIAHLDTVHKDRVTTIYQHKTEDYLIAKEGIGGDDRCGVLAILYIVAKGYKPFILFTTDEETGANGAHVAAKAFSPAPDIKFMVEIDRRGKNDSVYYDNDNKEFKKYIDSFGFIEAQGSFSDISVLGDAWNIASVNLSSGYYDAHSINEKIQLPQTITTAKKIIKMFADLPEKRFEHVEIPFSWKTAWGAGINQYYDDLYDDYKGASAVALTPAQTDDAAFKGIAIKHLEKAAKCIESIKAFPFVNKVHAKDVTVNAKSTDMPFFSTNLDDKTHWIMEILKKNSPFYVKLSAEEILLVQPCISFLQNIYKQYPNFDAALYRYAQDPAKWKAFITSSHKKKVPAQKSTAVMQRFKFDSLPTATQYKMLDESLDTLFTLRESPNVKKIAIESGRIIANVQFPRWFATTSIGVLAMEKEFKEVASKQMIDRLLTLDMQVRMYTGLDAAIKAAIDNMEKKTSTTSRKGKQSTLKLTPFERLSPKVRQALIEEGLTGIDYMENTINVRAVTVANDNIHVVYDTAKNSSKNVTIGFALADDAFLKLVQRSFPDKFSKVITMFNEILSSIKNYTGYADALAGTRTARKTTTTSGKNIKKEVEENFSSAETKLINEQLAPLLDTQSDVNDFVKIWKKSKDSKKALAEFKEFKANKVKKSEAVFDDAPACGKKASREIIDRFEPSGKNDEDRGPYEEMTLDEAMYVLQSYFNNYSFFIDPEGDDCESFFIDNEGIERPIKDLATEIGSISSKKTKRNLKNAHLTLLGALN